MTRWTDAKAYAPDLYASLAAVTLPDTKGAMRGFTRRSAALRAEPVALSQAKPAAAIARPDLSLAAVMLPDGGALSRRDTPALTTRFRRAVARQAPDILTWAVIGGCFLLLASGAL